MTEIKITDYAMHSEQEQESQLEIISGDFFEGETVTVRVQDKVYTRKVKYSARKWADLYITINGYDITFSEFYDHESFKDTDYSYITEGRAK